MKLSKEFQPLARDEGGGRGSKLNKIVEEDYSFGIWSNFRSTHAAKFYIDTIQFFHRVPKWEKWETTVLGFILI